MLVQALVLALIAIFIGISNSAGIGGGIITNVLLIGGLGYSAKQSIVVSYIFLMGGGLAATLAGAKKFTASGKRFIDYDLVLITLPMIMSGAIVGVMLNHLLSELIISLLFVALILSVMSTIYKRMGLQSSQPELPPLQMQLLEANGKETGDFKQRLSEILSQENALLPLDKLKVVAQIYAYTVIAVLMRGGKTFESVVGLQSCGIGSYILAMLHIVLSYLYCKSTAMKQFQRDNEKESLGYVFASQKEKMSEQKMREGMFNGFIAGVLGATVAIGGGLVLVPIWMKAGMEKQIVVNSTAPLIFFSASVSFLISALLGHYESVWEVLAYLTLSFVGSFFVKTVVMHLTEQYGLKRLVYILLLFVSSVSLSLFVPLQFAKYQEDAQQFLQFDSFC